MTIHDSWQDRERGRKARLRLFQALSPSEKAATWQRYMEAAVQAWALQELPRNPIWPKAPDAPPGAA